MEFNYWTVLELPIETGKYRTALCRCRCGTTRRVRWRSLNNGNSKSCGCLTKEVNRRRMTNHGLSGHCLFKTWEGMMARCYSQNSTSYPHYGARGISVCERWHDVASFIADVSVEIGDRPYGYQLDRIENDGNYEPGNVRWSTVTMNNNNKRTCHYLEFNGERHSVAEWGEITGLGRGAIQDRIKRHGWPVDRALTEPKMRKAKTVA